MLVSLGMCYIQLIVDFPRGSVPITSALVNPQLKVPRILSSNISSSTMHSYNSSTRPLLIHLCLSSITTHQHLVLMTLNKLSSRMRWDVMNSRHMTDFSSHPIEV